MNKGRASQHPGQALTAVTVHDLSSLYDQLRDSVTRKPWAVGPYLMHRVQNAYDHSEAVDATTGQRGCGVRAAQLVGAKRCGLMR